MGFGALTCDDVPDSRNLESFLRKSQCTWIDQGFCRWTSFGGLLRAWSEGVQGATGRHDRIGHMGYANEKFAAATCYRLVWKNGQLGYRGTSCIGVGGMRTRE